MVDPSISNQVTSLNATPLKGNDFVGTLTCRGSSIYGGRIPSTVNSLGGDFCHGLTVNLDGRSSKALLAGVIAATMRRRQILQCITSTITQLNDMICRNI